MDKMDLREYLDIVVNMEKNIYLQNNLIHILQERYDRLSLIEMPLEPKMDRENAIIMGGMGLVFALMGALCLYVGMQIPLLGFFICFLGGCFFLGVVIFLISSLYEFIKQYAIYKKAKKRYSITHTEYQKNIEENTLKQQCLSREIQSLQEQHTDSKERLEQIYSKNIIFPKYRNLVMMCSIYEYVCSGRCTTLEGHEGAYNILEMEIRLDHIVTQLNTVISQLDAIKNNQYMLFSVIQETNRKTEQILESANYIMDSMQSFHGQASELVEKITSIERNSELAAYQSQSIQKELQYMNRMNYLSGL